MKNNSTIVTALYNIGREQFAQYPRSINTYLSYMDNILSLDANICIFCEEELVSKIRDTRKQYDKSLTQTVIHVVPFNDLECYKLFFGKTKEVMNTEFFLRNNQGSIESLYPEYNIINFNKISFVNEIINLNPFSSNYFFWIDAGFYHDKFPKQYRGSVFPKLDKVKKLEDEKVHFLSLCPEANIPLESMFSSRVSIAGSMFAGKAEPLKQFKRLVYETVTDFLANNAVNDDQAIYAHCYAKRNNLFSFSFGNWFDNFYNFV